jgi:hypothetical protein
MKEEQHKDLIDTRLLELLTCPVCLEKPGKTAGSLELAGGKLVCRDCGRRYAIIDGVPNMLPEEAEHPPDGGGS